MFWVKSPFKQKNSMSLIFTNLKLKFEPHVLNLFFKFLAKDPKKRRYNLNIMNFEVKKFTVRNSQKKTLMFECYNLLDPMDWRAVILEVDIQQGNFKILQFLPQVLIFLFVGELDFFNNARNCRIWSKEYKEF
jgi:hypothetical protein